MVSRHWTGKSNFGDVPLPTPATWTLAPSMLTAGGDTAAMLALVEPPGPEVGDPEADSPLHAAMPTTAASTNAAAVRERKSCLPSFPDACRVIRHTGADRATPKPVSRA